MSVSLSVGGSLCVSVIQYLCLLCVVGFPLTVLGGIVGKNTSGEFDSPCRTKNIAREIPPVAW